MNADSKVMQTKVYDHFFEAKIQDGDNIMTKLRKAIKQYKEKIGQFIIPHMEASPNEWVFVNISDDKEKWYLFNEADKKHSIPGNAWNHNSHSSSSFTHERIFEAAYLTITRDGKT